MLGFVVQYITVGNAVIALISGLLLHFLYELYPGGGGTAIYGLYRYVPRGRVWFSSSLLYDRVYKSERSRIGYHFSGN